MKRFSPGLGIGLFITAMLIFSSVYVVREGQHAILLRLGKMVVDSSTGQPAVKGPGLHFKVPFLNQARLFDTRMQTLDLKSSRIVTAEKKDVLVDYYVKWRISNLPLYFKRTSGNAMQAQLLLSQKVNDGLRAKFGKRTIKEVVSGERSDIMLALQAQANESAQGLGIDVIDVRIKRIDLPAEVSAAVFARMRAERQRIAAEHRAQGRAAAAVIQADADAQGVVIIATANKQAEQLRGEGDALAAKIYAHAYSRDSSFYSFYRSLIAYRHVFTDKKDVLVLKPTSHFFKYFNQAKNNNRS